LINSLEFEETIYKYDGCPWRQSHRRHAGK
jgi:hypothetical protein